jgi:KUP system potassium uptake protein
VYGDIGTSPLYALKASLDPDSGLVPDPTAILGLLSLVFWSLVLVVCVKYLTFVLRADNQGDGGIMALLALLAPGAEGGEGSARRTLRSPIVLLALVGTGLLLADCMITPAISVVGAIEGLSVAAPRLRPAMIPIAVLILVSLFSIQRLGSGKIGAIFGPFMLLWFAVIGCLGVPWILREPAVLEAINPVHAVRFLAGEPRGFVILGSVVLCITGAEALYADMGHFGRVPILWAWYAAAFPGLLFNYFGQGALLLNQGQAAAANPFFSLAPEALRLPLVAIATLAAIIASQAVITGSYSLAMQAVHLGFLPRLTIRHTSAKAYGQIFMPEINGALMLACLAAVAMFRDVEGLSAAYGVAVMGTMTITTLLLLPVARRLWKWSIPAVLGLGALSLGLDLSFLLACLQKIPKGGWFPLSLAVGMTAVMATWKRGRAELARSQKGRLSETVFLEDVRATRPVRVSGTAVFLTGDDQAIPRVLLHHFKHNKVLHEHVLLMTLFTEALPRVPASSSVSVHELGLGFYRVVARYGFTETPNVPQVLERCNAIVPGILIGQPSYYLGRDTLIPSPRTGMARWRKHLFIVLTRNARNATAYFGLPPDRVVELGAQIEI